MKSILFSLALTLGFTGSVFSQTNKNLYLGFGPSFEVTRSVAGSITGDTDYMGTGTNLNIGFKTVLHANIGRFGLEWYGMVKKARTQMRITDYKPEDAAYFDKIKSNAYQDGTAFETGIYAGANFAAGKHELYAGIGGGVAYNRFNGYGSSTLATPKSRYQPDTTAFIESAFLDDNPLEIATITPVVSGMVSFRQKLKNPKLGIVYSLENKWGVTPAMDESFVYDVILSNNTRSTHYVATFSDIRFIHVTASVLFTFDLMNKKVIKDPKI